MKQYVLPRLAPMVLALIFAFPLCGQFDWPALSPPGLLEQTVGQATLTVAYERPAARGRKIFGALVPWNKVWRTGAGFCTRIGFDREVRLGGQTVPTGKYSLFTIPREDTWTIILNRDTSLYGSSDYDETEDVVRFVVPSERSHRYYESLTIDVDPQPNDAEIYISWTDVMVHFPLETNTDFRVMQYIRGQLMTGEAADINDYGMAAEELYLAKRELNTALLMARKSVEADPGGGWGYRLWAETLAAMGYYDRAVEVLDEVIAFRIANPLGEEEQQAWDLREWRRMRQKYSEK